MDVTATDGTGECRLDQFSTLEAFIYLYSLFICDVTLIFAIPLIFQSAVKTAKEKALSVKNFLKSVKYTQTKQTVTIVIHYFTLRSKQVKHEIKG